MTKHANNVATEWPSNTHFTIDDISSKYPNIAEITLRYRINKAIENKQLIVIGKMKPVIGRPRIVLSRINPSQEVIDKATSEGVIVGPTNPVKSVKSMVNVTNVVSQETTEEKLTKISPFKKKETVTTSV